MSDHGKRDNSQRDDATRQRLDGMVDQVKGRARQAIGGLTGETDEQLRGKGEELRGKMKNAIGKVRQEAADLVDDVDDHTSRR